jgi:branched-subunit amino acid transport protein AzlD
MGGIKSCGISGILLIYCYFCVSTGLESFGSEHDVEEIRVGLILVCARVTFWFYFDL